jgi:hypothetical protein
MRRAAVFKWWKRFRGGETNVKDQNRLFHYLPEVCVIRYAARFREVDRLPREVFPKKETVNAPSQSSDAE